MSLSPEERHAWLEAEPTAPRQDDSLEPEDEVIAELQNAVVQSRLRATLSLQQLVDTIDRETRELVATGDPEHAIAIAAAALRLREEYPRAL